MNTEYLVISAIGADRLGIADDIAAMVSTNGCNIEESKMAVLGGEFAVIMLVSGNGDKLTSLSAHSDELGRRLGLHVEMRSTRAPLQSEGRPYIIESLSLDTPGILHAVTAVLKNEGINIEELETETSSAPWTGAPMFKMKIRISLPREKALAPFRRLIEDLAEKEDLDIRLEALSGLGSE